MTNFKVMLAHPVGKKEFDKDSFIQPKLDGVRCYITYHGAFSRNHKRFMNVQHITAVSYTHLTLPTICSV